MKHHVFIICILVMIIICFIVYLNLNFEEERKERKEEVIEERIILIPIEYKQVGILIPDREDGTIAVLPLMGRRLNRDKWQYYAISNQHNNVRLPIKIRGKEATNEYGVDRIYKGDCDIVVEGQRERFKANIYEETNLIYF